MDTVSIDPRTLYNQLGGAQAPIVVDVRRPEPFDADREMLAGALRIEGDLVALLPRLQPGRAVVAYCVKGAEVGQQAACALAEAGLEAAYLAGGIRAWRRSPPRSPALPPAGRRGSAHRDR